MSPADRERLHAHKGTAGLSLTDIMRKHSYLEFFKVKNFTVVD